MKKIGKLSVITLVFLSYAGINASAAKNSSNGAKPLQSKTWLELVRDLEKEMKTLFGGITSSIKTAYIADIATVSNQSVKQTPQVNSGSYLIADQSVQSIKSYLQVVNREDRVQQLICDYIAPSYKIDSKIVNQMKKLYEKAGNLVTSMIIGNKQKFEAFREVQRKGVEWPHSQELRLLFKRNGFVFRPMMIKRDRMVCGSCSAECSGLSETDVPYLYHKNNCPHRKNSAPVQSIVQIMFCTTALYPLVGENNLKFCANFYAAITQLSGWKHLAYFVDSPQQYIQQRPAFIE